MQKAKNSLRILGLLVFIIVLICCLNTIFPVRAITDTGFYKMEKDSVDVLILGNCHAYSTFMPSIIESVTGKKGYVLGGSSQNVQLTYYHLKEALKRQSPAYVVLETFPVLIYESYIDTTTIDAYVYSNFADLPFSLDKMLYAMDYASYDKNNQWFYLWFNLGYFHDRWGELQTLDNQRQSQDNGYNVFWNYQPLSDPAEPLELVQTDVSMEIDPDYLRYLYKIMDLVESSGAQMILTTVPYTSMTFHEAARCNTLAEIAQEHSIPYINFAKQDMLEKLDIRRGYMIDANHVNEQGGVILSAYLGDIIQELDEKGTTAFSENDEP